jgi:hypothetical protein
MLTGIATLILPNGVMQGVSVINETEILDPSFTNLNNSGIPIFMAWWKCRGSELHAVDVKLEQLVVNANIPVYVAICVADKQKYQYHNV